MSGNEPLVPASDLLVRALARYVEALDRRYPGGPGELRAERLDGRSIITPMSNTRWRRIA